MNRNATTPRARSSRTSASPSPIPSSLRNRLENKRSVKTSSRENLQKVNECWDRFRDCVLKQYPKTIGTDNLVKHFDPSDNISQNKHNEKLDSDPGNSQPSFESEELSVINAGLPRPIPGDNRDSMFDLCKECSQQKNRVEEFGVSLADGYSENVKSPRFCFVCEKDLANERGEKRSGQDSTNEDKDCKKCCFCKEKNSEESYEDEADEENDGKSEELNINETQERVLPKKEIRAWMLPENKVLPSIPSSNIGTEWIEEQHGKNEKTDINVVSETDENSEIGALDWYVLRKMRELFTPKLKLSVAIFIGLLISFVFMYELYTYSLEYLKPSLRHIFPTLKRNLGPPEKLSVFEKISKYILNPLRAYLNKFDWFKNLAKKMCL